MFRMKNHTAKIKNTEKMKRFQNTKSTVYKLVNIYFQTLKQKIC
jgi:hypothetical protein